METALIELEQLHKEELQNWDDNFKRVVGKEAFPVKHPVLEASLGKGMMTGMEPQCLAMLGGLGSQQQLMRNETAQERQARMAQQGLQNSWPRGWPHQ